MNPQKAKHSCKNLLNPFCVFSFVIWRPKLWWFLELVSIQDRAWLWGLAAVYLSSVAPGVHHHSAGNKCIPQISVYLERHHGNANFLPQAAERERERNQWWWGTSEREKEGKTGRGSLVRLIDSSLSGFWLHSFSHMPNGMHGQPQGLQWSFKLNKCLFSHCLV